MLHSRTCPSPGLTLLGLVLVIAIIAISLALLVSFATKVRNGRDGSGTRTQSLNNLRQMAMATLNYSITNGGKLLPGIGTIQGAQHSVFSFLLDYLEEQRVHEKRLAGQDVADVVIPVFVGPADISMPGGLQVQIAGKRYGAISYAANGFVFAGDRKGTDAFKTYYVPDGVVSGSATHEGAMKPVARLPRTFTDGASNTILFMEKYAVCARTDDNAARPGSHGWAYAAGYDRPYAPIQASLLLPQLDAALDVVDCALPQAFSSTGINISLADGSSRTVSPNIQPLIWAQALLPNDGMPMPRDWSE